MIQCFRMDPEAKAAIEKLTRTVTHGFASLEARTEKGFAAAAEGIAEVKDRLTSLEDRMDRGFAAVAEDIASIKDQMVTKDDLSTALKPIEDRLTSVESKIAGTNRRLDEEAMLRNDLALPKRVSDLEAKTFGASRHPKHIPLR